MDVHKNNLCAYGLRNFMLNDMAISPENTSYLEDGVTRMWHDGLHTLYVEFRDTSYVKEVFRKSR